jgi:hypothetical protein
MGHDDEAPVTGWLGIHEWNVKIPASVDYETMKGRAHTRPFIPRGNAGQPPRPPPSMRIVNVTPAPLPFVTSNDDVGDSVLVAVVNDDD